MHSESSPQGFSSVGLQLQRGISDRSAVKICTFPTGRFTFNAHEGYELLGATGYPDRHFYTPPFAYELKGCSDLVTARGKRTQLQAQLYFWECYFERQKVRGKSSGGCRFPISSAWCSVYSVILEGQEAAKCPPPILTEPTSSSGGQPSALAGHTSSL